MKTNIMRRVMSLLLVSVPILMAVSVFHPKVDMGLPKISYGIDLVGGGQIVLQVDRSAVEEKEVSVLQLFFEKSHQLNQNSSVITSLVFDGDSSLPQSMEDSYNMTYPLTKLTKTPMGFVISGMPDHIRTKVAEAATDNIGVLRTRLNELGVADIRVYRQGLDKVIVEVPHGNEMERIRSILSSSAEIGLYALGTDEDAVMVSKDDGLELPRDPVAIVEGKHIKRALAMINHETGQPVTSVSLDSEGGARMGDFTRQNIGNPIITTLTDSDYVDGVRNKSERVVSVATVQGNFSSDFIISGIGSLQENEDLVLILKSGVMNIPMFIVSETVIDSRLGHENAMQGFKALAIGLLLLAAYIVYLYRVRGVLSIITLIVTASLIVVALSFMGASLTLTGLAGIILTMGMAIDANIIILEREKELLGTTSTPMAESFKSSGVPILDANATTLLVAVILYNVSSVSLKGFAITLALGVICTVISSYFINMYFTKTWVKESLASDVAPYKHKKVSK